MQVVNFQGDRQIVSFADDWEALRMLAEGVQSPCAVGKCLEHLQQLSKQSPATRQHAWFLLKRLDVQAYAKTRNFLDGDVTRLSPYIESGLLHETEVRDFLKRQLAENWSDAYRFMQQLSWREFFQQKWQRNPQAPWTAQGDYKTGWRDTDYRQEMPAMLDAAQTPNALINQLIVELQTTGYLHNHGRLYLAAYVVHWCRVHWSVGANWMLRLLMDGNLASNHFSWQWVASVNAPKPYFFNLENAQKFCANRYDTSAANNPELNLSYEALQKKLFPNLQQALSAC